MAAKTKLELTWIGKDIRPRLEPRILIEEPELSYHAKARRDGDIFDNLLIHGDNLLALKALETDPALRGKVKCIFIDPPYNTGSAFEHYDDGLEHSIWLGMMRERLEILRNLLSDEGSIWITLDDNEVHYLKIVADEVFGRRNFMSNLIWEKADSPRMDVEFFSSRHDHMLVYSRDRSNWKLNRLSAGAEPASHYNKTDADGRRYYTKPLRAMGADGTREARPSMYFSIKAPDGEDVFPKNPDGSDSRWRWSPKRVEEESHRLEWVKGRNGWAPYFRIYAEDNDKRPPETIWPHSDVGSNRTAKLEAKGYIEGVKPFDTPKPERLIQRVLEIATNPGDLVLDSFAGSGTTGAVAHKMGRRWIMVELGDHAKTHIVPRLQKVIDGTDKGGVTEAADWKGGGGYRFARLAPSLLEKDAWGNWVIRKEYNPAMLAEAMCKHFNYTYAPSTEHFWMHGHSSETSYIYVTTNSLTGEQLRALSEEVGEHRSLLICCKAFEEQSARALGNLTIRKIPGAVLDRCEWGKDDYSLKIESLPMMQEDEEDDLPLAPKRNGKKDAATGDLFADEAEG
ncbi:site-specific DNA-methyltransferase [Phreatobacter sp.]|uniref:site-specific DNA-methyltransferase n=1 Tax=Phreatobacter sp. TaxID=1966341 RepID=UPI0025D38F34|nr:site-specific DNA-methyltransferase [Phreatobacter sp.]